MTGLVLRASFDLCLNQIVIRRLPPSLTKEELEEQLQPLPDVDYLEFFSSDTRSEADSSQITTVCRNLAKWNDNYPS